MDPVKQLLALADEEFSKPQNINDFNGIPHEIKSVPGLQKMIDEYLGEDDDLTILSGKIQGVGVPEGRFVLQKHDISIEPHTDDVDVGLYFCMYVLATERSTIGDTLYARDPSFSYVDAITNRKMEIPLHPGTFVAFNPRKKHSVVYYGYSYTVMLFTVKKIAKKGK